ncbi:hypothetical protein ABPG77_002443 [Micractinium sp. CCAP 211/92]
MLPAQAGFVLPPPLSLAQQVDRPTARSVQLSKKGAPWSDDEHKAFLAGLKAYGRGQWKSISRYYVPSRTPTQVASHAQKHFLRQSGAQKRRSRFSAVEEAAAAAVTAAAPLRGLSATAPGAAAAGPVPGAPALPSFFGHALSGASTQAPLQLLSAAPGARLGSVPGAAQQPLPPAGAVVGGIAMGVPIGVLPPLPSITTARGTELPILPVMPGRINALAASAAAAAAPPAVPAATTTTSVSADSFGSDSELLGLGESSRQPALSAAPAAVLPPLLPEVPLPLHTHARGGGAAAARPPAGSSRYTPPTGRTQQLLRLLELNEQQQQERAASGGAADGASSGSAPTAQHSVHQQQSSVQRVPSATAALDALAELAEAEAQSAEAADAAAAAAAAAGAATASVQYQTAQQLPRVHSGQAPLVSAF